MVKELATGRKMTLRVDYDPDTECPMDHDCQWRLYSFNRRSIHYGVPDGFDPLTIGMRRKMAVGLAFVLDYYEHGSGAYSLHGEGMQCRWDTANGAGLLVWEHDPKEMGAKSRDDRAKDARAFLDEYNAWMNGEAMYFILEDEDGNTVDSCGGFLDMKYMVSVINEQLKDGDVVAVGRGNHVRGLKCDQVETHDEDE